MEQHLKFYYPKERLDKWAELDEYGLARSRAGFHFVPTNENE